MRKGKRGFWDFWIKESQALLGTFLDCKKQVLQAKKTTKKMIWKEAGDFLSFWSLAMCEKATFLCFIVPLSKKMKLLKSMFTVHCTDMILMLGPNMPWPPGSWNTLKECHSLASVSWENPNLGNIKTILRLSALGLR